MQHPCMLRFWVPIFAYHVSVHALLAHLPSLWYIPFLNSFPTYSSLHLPNSSHTHTHTHTLTHSLSHTHTLSLFLNFYRNLSLQQSLIQIELLQNTMPASFLQCSLPGLIPIPWRSKHDFYSEALISQSALFFVVSLLFRVMLVDLYFLLSTQQRVMLVDLYFLLSTHQRSTFLLLVVKGMIPQFPQTLAAPWRER